MPSALTPRQRLVLTEAVAEIDLPPLPNAGPVDPSGPRLDSLAYTIRNRLLARYRAATATGLDRPGLTLTQEQVQQVVTQLVDKGLLVVARGADYTRRVAVTEAGRALLGAGATTDE